MAFIENSRYAKVISLRNLTGSAESAPSGKGAIFVQSGSLKTLADAVVHAGSLTVGGAIDGATNIDGSGDLSMGSITMTDFSVGSDGATSVLSLDVNSGGITEAGAISGATTITANGKITGNEFATDGNEFTVSTAGAVTAASITGSGNADFGGTLKAGHGKFSVATDGDLTVPQLTASHAKIGVLDVDTINSITTTETTLEVSDKVIVLALSGNAAATDGGGLKFGGGADDTNNPAEILFNDAADDELEFKFGGTLKGKVTAAGAISGSGALQGESLTLVNASVNAAGGASLTSANLNSGGITNAGAIGGATTIEASDLANLNGGIEVDNSGNKFTVSTAGAVSGSGAIHMVGAATFGASLATTGSITGSNGLMVGNSKFTVASNGVVNTSANITAAGSLTVGNGKGIFDSEGALTGSNGAQFKKINSNTSVVSFHAGDSPTTSNWMVLIKSGSSSGAANHSLNLNASSAESAHLSFFDTSVAPNGEDKANLKFSGGLMIMSSSADLSLRTGTGTGGTVGVQNLLHVSGNCEVDGDLTLPSGQTVTAGDFVALSDRGLKQDIAPMNGALEKVMQLEPVTYELKARPGVADLGFIAQDVVKVVPEVCAVDANGVGRGIDYGRMSAILAGAVKTQQLQIEELKTIVAKLQK